MTLKLVIDRFEDDIAVCLDMDDKRYHIPKNILVDLNINDIFTIELDEDVFHSPVLLREETEEVKRQVHQKMSKLFKRRSETEE